MFDPEVNSLIRTSASPFSKSCIRLFEIGEQAIVVPLTI